MKLQALCIIMVFPAIGCARDVAAPVAPDSPAPDIASMQANSTDEGPYRLWGEYSLYINEGHDSVDVVPERNSHFPLNALKFLEDYCKDCLQILSIRNNGDGTIDLTVRITHPFNGFPQYTGFDVKGIIMFNGSSEFHKTATSEVFPVEGTVIRASWKELGDPEVLNPDGYTFRWNPEWDSGSSQPIFNYWPGRFSTGTPTAHINAFLNFYSREERHMFEHDMSVTRTYHIWLPPGPVVAGYAVEACWEPPTILPVTNPLTDFPITANQPEPYVFNMVANNGETVTHCSDCCGSNCDELRFMIKDWGDTHCNRQGVLCPPPVDTGYGGIFGPPWWYYPCTEFEGWEESVGGTQTLCRYGNGEHQFIGWVFRYYGGVHSQQAFTLFYIFVDDPDLD